MSIPNLIEKLDLSFSIPDTGIQILVLLAEEGELNQREIVDELDLTKRQVTYAVGKLRDAELIHEKPEIRENGLSDLRSKLISLSSIVENDLIQQGETIRK